MALPSLVANTLARDVQWVESIPFGLGSCIEVYRRETGVRLAEPFLPHLPPVAPTWGSSEKPWRSS